MAKKGRNTTQTSHGDNNRKNKCRQNEHDNTMQCPAPSRTSHSNTLRLIEVSIFAFSQSITLSSPLADVWRGPFIFAVLQRKMGNGGQEVGKSGRFPGVFKAPYTNATVKFSERPVFFEGSQQNRMVKKKKPRQCRRLCASLD